MKIKVVSCCLLACFLYSCSNQQSAILENRELIPNEKMKILLDSFINQNKHENYIYELYIDKISPDICNLILYAGNGSLTELENARYKQTSLAYSMVSGVKVNIYSGIERYFDSKDKQSLNLNINTTNFNINPNYDDMIIWAIKDSFGIFDVYGVYGVYPFFGFPLKFTPPDILPNEYKQK